MGHYDNTVGDAHGFFLVVSDIDGGDVQRSLDSSYFIPHIGTQRTVESLLLEVGFNLGQCKPTLILGTTEAVVSAVESGAGIAFVSNLAIKKSLALDLIKVVEVEGLRLRRDFFCVYRKERIVSRLLEEFVSFVRLESV